MVPNVKSLMMRYCALMAGKGALLKELELLVAAGFDFELIYPKKRNT
jgi:hypothetical protein